ncbi:bacteriorhodopsin-like [Salinisphaera sp. LB1]|uniref:bacteriorhodopsin-like n=1 Tax=Salinisphaera sp. LB1 TaxID=2183911 RepID=UPI000D70837B|nr:bacteriorhodopsin-like [Salinisphaera sp. LB1]AWN15476.1 Proteorhodopsin [Salinisphaera sp. LB1]
MTSMSVGQFHLVGISFSFCFSLMAAATAFFWINRGQVTPNFRATITITGLVTLIAAYNYFRMFQSWEGAYQVADGTVKATGVAFNGMFRYADWVATVPLLLVELILVMRLPREETISRATRLSVLAVLMIVLGYPGEVASATSTRWIFGILSMLPFLWIVYELYSGLGDAISKQPDDARGLVTTARNLTVYVWFFYPVVYFVGAVGLDGATATTIIQIGYTIADLLAKAAFGVLIYMIAVRKSEAEMRSGGTQPAAAG